MISGRGCQGGREFTNLDGTVDFHDYTALDANIGEQHAWWRLGDTNWDGTTVPGDYEAVDANLTQTGGGAETLVFRTHDLQNELTDVGATSLGYDDNGAMTLDELGHTIAYDAWGRLVEVGGQNYGYDALGRRISITQDSPGTDPAKGLFYSDEWQVLEEREAGASVAKRQYVWSPVYVDAMVIRDQDSGTDGTLDERLYVQQDTNFNVTSLIDTSGAAVERYNYDPYGTITVLNADWSADIGNQSDVNWEYLFQGGRYDFASKLYHFRNRDYNPELGRWTRQDPLEYFDGPNMYNFVGNNPSAGLDPMGLYNKFDPHDGKETPGQQQGGSGTTTQRLNGLLNDDQQNCPTCVQEAKDLAAAIDAAIKSQTPQCGGVPGNIISGITGIVVNPTHPLDGWDKGGWGNQCGDWQELMMNAILPVLERYGQNGCFDASAVNAWKKPLRKGSHHNWVEISTKQGKVVIDPWPSGGDRAVDDSKAGGYPDTHPSSLGPVRPKRPTTQPTSKPTTCPCDGK